MQKNNINKILWTATHMDLPRTLWDRIESLGYGIIIAGPDDNTLSSIKKISPGLWIGQINGGPESGLSILKEVRSMYPGLPIILASMEPTIEEAVTAIKLGANEYLPGTVSQERLQAVIEGLLKYNGSFNLHRSPKKKRPYTPVPPIAVHESIRKVMALAEKIAPRRSTVLIQGESGTGKEVIARYIHHNSGRSSGPFVAVNCAALPENLLESELFGHEKGAFTGAITRKKGKFELADGGTLLLDEISEMALSVQAKLLRVLQEKEVDRLGGRSGIPIDTRIIATTNKDLEVETENGDFRLDLFYRLNVVPLILSPLRERPDDIVPLARHFLKEHAALNNIPEKKLTPEAEDLLRHKRWPGNIRELENLMERVTLLVDSENIEPDDLELMNNLEARKKDPDNGGGIQVMPLRDMEKKMILQALNEQKGNRTHASRVLGISVRTLRNKLHEYEKELEKEQGAQ